MAITVSASSNTLKSTLLINDEISLHTSPPALSKGEGAEIHSELSVAASFFVTPEVLSFGEDLGEVSWKVCAGNFKLHNFISKRISGLSFP